MIGNATMDIVKTAGQKMVRSFFELMSLSLGSRKRGKIEGSEPNILRHGARSWSIVGNLTQGWAAKVPPWETQECNVLWWRSCCGYIIYLKRDDFCNPSEFFHLAEILFILTHAHVPFCSRVSKSKFFSQRLSSLWNLQLTLRQASPSL